MEQTHFSYGDFISIASTETTKTYKTRKNLINFASALKFSMQILGYKHIVDRQSLIV